MGISYIADLSELAVLAHFSGYGGLVGFPTSVPLDENGTNAVLNRLTEKGMVALRRDLVLVDPVMRMLVVALAEPELLIRHGGGGACCYLRRELGVLVRPDTHAPGRYLLTPGQTARELAEMLLEDGDSVEFYVCAAAGEARRSEYGLESLVSLMEQVYKHKGDEEEDA